MRKVTFWQHEDVKPDGTFGDPALGSVEKFPMWRSSREPYSRTPSLEADGHWVSVSTGRLPDGTVTGITVYFESIEELESFVSGEPMFA